MTRVLVLSILVVGACSKPHRQSDEPPPSDSATMTEPAPTFPGQTSPPEIDTDVYALLQLVWTGIVNGNDQQQRMSLVFEVFDGTGTGDLTLPLLYEGSGLDDCTVYGSIGGSAFWGYPADDAGDFQVTLGDVSFPLTQDENGYYLGFNMADVDTVPEWGSLVSASLADAPSAPGFAFDPLTDLPAGPVGLSGPAPFDADAPPKPASQVELPWDGLGASPLTLQLSPILPDAAYNVFCTVEDDGSFVVPQHVYDGFGSDPVLVQCELQRNHSRYVEVEPEMWAAFYVKTWDFVSLLVDPDA